MHFTIKNTIYDIRRDEIVIYQIVERRDQIKLLTNVDYVVYEIYKPNHQVQDKYVTTTVKHGHYFITMYQCQNYN